MARVISSPAVIAIAALAASAVVVPQSALAADSGTCPAPAAYPGAGTAGDPYVITSPGQLQGLRDTPAHWGADVRVAADIDMSGCTWGGSIGDTGTAFRGVLDGDGHVIRGFALAHAGGYAGFIGYLDDGAVVRDLGVSGTVSVSVRDGEELTVYAGGLAGFTRAATIDRSSFAGRVSVGVTAIDTQGACPPFCDVGASIIVGGLVGYGQGAIVNSYARAQVTASAIASPSSGGYSTYARVTAGGLVGELAGSSSLDRVYAAGAISSSANAPSGQQTIAEGALLGRRGSQQVAASAWDATLGPGGDGAGAGGPAGTGFATPLMTGFTTFGPQGLAWDITDGISQATTWSICASDNDGYPFLSRFATTAACPAPGPGPAPDPGNGGTSSGAAPTAPGGTSGGAAASPVATATTMLRVDAQRRPRIPVGRRSTVVESIRTDGRVTGVSAWCELGGIRLPSAVARRLCGIRVLRGPAASARSGAAMSLHVTARPQCSRGLVVRVRVSSRREGAPRATWSRSWTVSSSTPVPCRIAPKYAVTG